MGWPSAWGQATPPSVLPALKMQGGGETVSTKRKVNPINTATWLSLNKRERHEHTVTASPLGMLLTLNYLRSTAHPLLPQMGNVSSENFIRVHFLHVSEKDNSSSQNVMVIAHKGMRAKFIQYQLSISTRPLGLSQPHPATNIDQEHSRAWNLTPSQPASRTLLCGAYRSHLHNLQCVWLGVVQGSAFLK